MEKLSKDEYEKVGPTLGKFYNKLIRFNSSNGINIVQENEGISLIDDKGDVYKRQLHHYYYTIFERVLIRQEKQVKI